MGQLYKPYLDENGAVIEGLDKELANQKLGQKWKVVKGVHAKLQPYCTLKIEALALLGSFHVNDYWNIIGYVNSDSNSLGGAAAGKLRFDGVRAYGSIENDALLDVQFFFSYHQSGWNNQLFSQKYSPGAKDIEEGKTGTILQTKTEVFATYDENGENETPTTSSVRVLYPEANFSFFKSYLNY